VLNAKKTTASGIYRMEAQKIDGNMIILIYTMNRKKNLKRSINHPLKNINIIFSEKCSMPRFFWFIQFEPILMMIGGYFLYQEQVRA